MIEVFQVKHQTGFLLWKKVYYKYFRYLEGRMIAVSVYSEKTIEGLEYKK